MEIRRREITSSNIEMKSWQSAAFRARDRLHNLYNNQE